MTHVGRLPAAVPRRGRAVPRRGRIYFRVSRGPRAGRGGSRSMTESTVTAWDQRFSTAARGMRFSAIRRMSALIEKPGIISFAPGQPSPETFPVEAFRDILAETLATDGAASFQYILTRGLAPLLVAVREYCAAKGMPAGASEVMM